MRATCTPTLQRRAIVGACIYMTPSHECEAELQADAGPTIPVDQTSHRKETDTTSTPEPVTTAIVVPTPEADNCVYQSRSFTERYDALVESLIQPPPMIQSLLRVATYDELRARSWSDCLPLHTVVCGVTAGSQDSLFTQHPPCRSAIVHHLLATAIAVVRERGRSAVLTGAALQHVWVFGALPPQMPTARVLLTNTTDDLSAALWARGFAHFYDETSGDTVTCMARHHALATVVNAGDAPPDVLPPHLRWERHNEQVAPSTCLSLYDVVIRAPEHPETIVSAAQSKDVDAAMLVYPNPSCQALCDHDTPAYQRDVPAKVAQCPRRDDAEYNARLATYLEHPLPLNISPAHALNITPFSNTTKLREGNGWEFCIPIKPQQCGARRGVKSTLFETPQGKPCRSAVLQLLLENMLEVVEELHLPSFVYFGTLLGAWRDEAIIPHTADVDVVLPSFTNWTLVQDMMWARGFYAFVHDIHRACLASHHPLASLLYAPNQTRTDSSMHGTPYLDLYMWRKEYEPASARVEVETAWVKLNASQVFPLTCNHTIFGSPVPGIQHPEAMLKSEYGDTYGVDPNLRLAACESYCDYQLLSNMSAVSRSVG
ncbi:hypothetical protein SDRG_12021 [Saprolegnia diclina VS20]|uniref:Uncharacterized protein n=1 Tax=Saprolegnia diclina (strain VS20) TaxID=1156394 RepID=T0RD47_SAPDV|nr:hypothetical protein SDRG_12021 [Saprolegnia diclina VS20]EQC30168.1 hypothetical protein SDRG_12021 [Saprolegnia diclina VS20]|eukprot:XP_008616300.1 hypothetical protein SDRG_12021 [Saprolegnia diclina VS20]